jgi:hypothetical protein
MTKKTKKEDTITLEAREDSSSNGASQINLMDVCLSLDKSVKQLSECYEYTIKELETLTKTINRGMYKPSFIGKLFLKKICK